MKIAKTTFEDGTVGYDIYELKFCCPELRYDIIGDGGAIKLTANGLCLRQNENPNKSSRRIKYCPECGKEVTHEEKKDEIPIPAELKAQVKDPVKK